MDILNGFYLKEIDINQPSGFNLFYGMKNQRRLTRAALPFHIDILSGQEMRLQPFFKVRTPAVVLFKDNLAIPERIHVSLS
jgi:hypothetical protein